MADRKQYVLTRKVMGAKPMAPGDVVELTDKQARSPVYRNRVRLHDSNLTSARGLDPQGGGESAPMEFVVGPAAVVEQDGDKDKGKDAAVTDESGKKK